VGEAEQAYQTTTGSREEQTTGRAREETTEAEAREETTAGRTRAETPDELPGFKPTSESREGGAMAGT